MKDINAVLEQIGLTGGEIRAYLALLELGPSTYNGIVEKSKLSSSKVYEVLDRLILKGLVSMVKKDRYRVYTASSPKQIQDYLFEKKRVLESQEAALGGVMPQLMALQTTFRQKEEAHIYEGFKGLKTIFDDLLNTVKKGGEYYVYTIPATSSQLSRFFQNFHLKRSGKGIKAKLLFAEKANEEALKQKGYPLTEHRFLPKKYQMPSVLNVYEGKIIFYLARREDSPIAVLVKSDALYQTHKTVFDILWNLSRPSR